MLISAGRSSGDSTTEAFWVDKDGTDASFLDAGGACPGREGGTEDMAAETSFSNGQSRDIYSKNMGYVAYDPTPA